MKKSISLLLFVSTTLLFTGCFWQNDKTPEELAQEEKENFIAANAEMTCEILKNPELAVNIEASKELAKEVFEKYDFPIDDNEAMVLILDKYETDAEAVEAVQAKLEAECELEEEPSE